MYWFSRPPYGKYAAVLVLLIVGVYAEFRPSQTVAHPFAIVDVAAGAPLDSSLFTERHVPTGSLPSVVIEGTAAHRLRTGEPLLPSGVDTEPLSIPKGWWALQVPLPDSAAAGMEVRLVLRPPNPSEPPAVVPGLVIEPSSRSDDPLGFDSSNGLVAVPEAEAAPAAVAVADRRITVLITP